MNREQFRLIQYLHKNGYSNQRKTAQDLGYSLGKTKELLNELKENAWVDDSYMPTAQGLLQLEPYRVKNAVIMAAGMSSRFAPLSYEKPKGLLPVRGEILIERQIRQLQEAGITDITVVVGYMKEQFFYLEEKFGVDIVINEDYFRYNNTSTLIRVLDRLDNTYICSSDNYFTENVFEPFVFQGYYSAVYQSGASDEFGLLVNGDGQIVGIDHHPENMLIMLGHVYFSRDFSRRFAEILQREYPLSEVKGMLWESLYERHLDELVLYAREYPVDRVLEFDSLQELRSFDPRYLENSGSNIFRIISRELNCRDSDIQDISVMKQGSTNLSFHFECLGQRYVYRHPGVGTEKYICRPSEAFSMHIAQQLHLDNTLIAISGEEGWKLSRYIENARTLDYHNKHEAGQALSMMRRLHDAAIHSDYDFDIWKTTQSLIQKVSEKHRDYPDFSELLKNMEALYALTEKDRIPKVLCHCDCCNPNFLIDADGHMTLIDWEYSGNDDPANDPGTFICCSDYSFEEAMEVIRMYYDGEPSPEQLRHVLAYVAIASFYRFVRAIYRESVGNTIDESKSLWYKKTKTYMHKALSLYPKIKTDERQ